MYRHKHAGRDEKGPRPPHPSQARGGPLDGAAGA
jgi:hypothetical protein